MKRFHYLSPKVYPLFPEASGQTVFGIFVRHAVETCAEQPDFSGTIRAIVSTYCDGKMVQSQEHVVEFNNGTADRDVIWCVAGTPGLGYAEVEIKAERSLFGKLIQESGYALFSGVDGRCLTINSDEKYANYRVIEQIKTWRKFCLLHSAVYVSSRAGCGNSMLLINPYDRPIVVGLKSSDRSLRVRVESKSAQMVDLEALVADAVFGTVMLSANNRIVVYDVKHPYKDWLGFNSIDHLDVFSGIATRYQAPIGEALANVARRGVRRLGLRFV